MKAFFLSLTVGTMLFVGVRPATLPASDPDDAAIVLPPGFRALVVADNLVVDRKGVNNAEELRGLAVAANGDIYAKGKFGKIFALRDSDGDGRADVIKEFGPGDGGTHVAFHDGWLYHSSRTAEYRYKYTPESSSQRAGCRRSSRIFRRKKITMRKPSHSTKAARCCGNPIALQRVQHTRSEAGAKRDGPDGVSETYGGFWRFDANKRTRRRPMACGSRRDTVTRWRSSGSVSKAFFMVQMGRDNLNVVDPVTTTRSTTPNASPR